MRELRNCWRSTGEHSGSRPTIFEDASVEPSSSVPTIQADQLIRTPDSVITASGSVAGNIVIAAPNTDISSSLIVLPGTFLDAGSQLREACAARGDRPASSLTRGGCGGLPPDPGAPLAGHPFGQRLTQQAASGAPTALTPRPTQAAESVTVVATPRPVLGAPRPACRG